MITSCHLLRMFGLFSRRHLVLFVFLFSSCLIFYIGFWNGQDVGFEKRLKMEKQFHENSGGGRKLQLSPNKSQSTNSLKVPPSSSTTSKSKVNLEGNMSIKRSISNVKAQVLFESKGPVDDEKEFIVDIEEEDIPRVKPKLTNKTVARLASLNRPLPPVQRSLFSFTALRHSMNSIKNPMHYGAALAKTRMALEIGDHGIDISEYKPPKNISKSIQDSEILLDKNKIHLDSAPNFFLGDSIPAKNAKHILVITSWRSGSTFLGDILNHYPGTFYTFEPLHYISRLYQNGNESLAYENDIRSALAKDAIDLMSTIYKCNFDKSIMGYLSHVAQPANQFLFKHNFRLWNICSTLLPANSACFMPEFYRATCPLYPIRLIKTVRLRVPFIEDLIRDPEIGSNLKIVMLTRDPRGVMTSRSAMNWCENPQCSSPELACKDLDEDLEAAAHLKALYPEKMFLIRYEDLSLEPFSTTDRLLEFLDLKPNKLIDQFLESHTKTKRPGAETDTDPTEPSPTDATTAASVTENPYGTSRDSRQTAFAWKSKIDFSYLRHIQELCFRPMQKLGYNPIGNLTERDDPDFRVLVKSAEEISSLKLNQEKDSNP